MGADQLAKGDVTMPLIEVKLAVRGRAAAGLRAGFSRYAEMCAASVTPS